MRALLKHPGNHKRGKLYPEIPEPSWLADPSHRTKGVIKYIFALAALPKIKSTCTKIDAVRVKKYFGYMIKTNRDRTISEIKIAPPLLLNTHLTIMSIVIFASVDLN